MMDLPAFLDTSVQILKKQLPCDQNPHHNRACKCRAFSKHISSSHTVISPIERKKKCFINNRSLL